MNILIQKFGGTSLEDPETRQQAIEKIILAKEAGFSPVVVVSAMGRNGSPYATDTLKNLIGINQSYGNHKHMDLLLSCGEIISAVVLSDLLESAGLSAAALTGWQAGIITDDHFGDADILSIEKETLLGYLEDHIIPVVTGFQGMTSRREITTLGRGGSDTTAVALGVALKAAAVEIFTDVDGIMTADPRVVPQACMLDEIHYDEVFQMADQGAKIIHPRAVEIARQNNISIRIRNTRSGHPGTLICSSRQSFDTRYRTGCRQELLTAVTQKNDLTQVIIYPSSNEAAESRLFDTMSASGISIDMINFSLKHKAFIVEAEKTEKLCRLLEEGRFRFEVCPHVSKVTIIGNRITGIPGVMATVVRALTREGIQLLQSSDSHTTISCLVKSTDAHRAVQALHREFGLDRREL
jgi:aspartate kinase